MFLVVTIITETYVAFVATTEAMDTSDDRPEPATESASPRQTQTAASAARPIRPDNWGTMSRSHRKNWKQQGGTRPR